MPAQWENVEDFLTHCCEHNEIDLDYVRSDSFYNMLRQCDWLKEPLYEALYYSRTSSLDIVLDRSLAKTWVMDERLFIAHKATNTWRTRKFPIDLGRGHAKFQDNHLKKMLLEEDAQRGTKYTALANFEKNGVKIQADIVATRSTLVNLMMSGIDSTRALTWIYAVNDQLFLEDDKKGTPFNNPSVMTGPNFEELMTVRQKMVNGRFCFEWAKNSNEKYYTLVRHSCSLLNDSILVACEIDAVRPLEVIDLKHSLKEKLGLDDPVKNLERYVEFKARVQWNSGLQNFHPALIQCHLAGTPTLVVGLKDKLKLTSVKEWDVNKVLSGGMKRLEKWFLDRWLIFLVRFIKTCILKKRNGKLQSFCFDVEGSKLVMREITRSRLHFEAALTSDFLKWREEHPQRALDDQLATLLGPLSIKDKTIVS